MESLEKQLSVIRRGVTEIVPEAELINKLQGSIKTGKPLRVKYGIDPTSPDVHLGHTVPIRTLRRFQEMGHVAVLIIGDYTAMVGDPSGKNKTRKQLSHDDVMANARTYHEQLFRILDPAKTEVVHNGDWFSKLNFAEVIHLASNITVAQMLEREDFKKRYTTAQAISLHEFLYPLMQGYDSVVVRADVELGGTDQKFNIIVGRDLQKSTNQEPQIALLMPILLGTDGKEKMSKSLGNYVGINETPQSMFHKLINIPDTIVANYYELLTDVSVADIKRAQTEAAAGQLDIRQWKSDLAKAIVTQYHGAEKALQAEADERAIHAGGVVSADAPVVLFESDEINVVDAIVQSGLLPSNGEARRMIQNGGVSLDNEKIGDPKSVIKLIISSERVLRIGKRKFARLKKKQPQ